MHIICNIDGAIGRSRPLSANESVVRCARTGGVAREIPFDLEPAFIAFLQARATWPVALSLVSEEPEQIVYAMLERRRFGELPVFARRRVGPAIENPFAREGCPASAGVCKCAIAGFWSEPRWPMTVYIGHTRSDACVARRVDLLFASGELAGLARARRRPFVPYETFDDVRLALERRIAPLALRR